MNILKRQIKEYLNCHESAPGAYALVLSIVKEVPDEELNQIYENSEGYNDAERDSLIDIMTGDQLMVLAAYLLEIASEQLNYLDEESEDAGPAHLTRERYR